MKFLIICNLAYKKMFIEEIDIDHSKIFGSESNAALSLIFTYSWTKCNLHKG